MTADADTDVAVRYCERWNIGDRAPINPLSEDEAAARHESGDLYTAVLGSGETPVLVEVKLKAGYVAVHWLEEHGRDKMVYTFRRRDERLFLTQVDFNTVSDDGKVTHADITTFSPDGTVKARKFNNLDGSAESGETTTDVSAMWEDVPAFGHYDSLVRRER